MVMTRNDMEKMLGPLDNQLAADIARTGATASDLAVALTWLHADEAWMNEGEQMPSGVVAELVDLLEAGDEENMSHPAGERQNDWT